MKKIIIFIFIFVFLNADIIASIEQNKINAKLKSIKTYKDYLEFEKDLKKEAIFLPQQGFFLLGILKMQDLKLKGKVIKADYNQALFFFKKALESGNNLAAYYYALIQSRANNIYDALNVLDNVLSKQYNLVQNATKNSIYTLLAIEYATIILDNLKKDKEAIKKAIKYLSKLNADNDLARYLYANLYYFLGEKYYNVANYLLNSVCSKKDLSPQLKKQCESNPYIKGVKVITNCPLIKKFN